MRMARVMWWRAMVMGFVLTTSGAAMASSCAWPDWDHFRQTTLSKDGRVIDASTPEQVTVSEGQAYGLFFALVANDRPTFDLLLTWTQNNLAQGDLSQHLPAWQWGRRAAKPGEPESWGVLDSNSASDADLWIAYALLEAGRLWHERSYTALGTVLAREILAKETTAIPDLGRTVMPGPVGFQPDKDTWRLNPSYVPLQVMTRLAQALPTQTEWRSLLESSRRVLVETAPRGYSPDWILYRRGKGFQPDEASQAESAYNAIRVYLWAGTMAPNTASRDAVLATFRPLADDVAARGAPPERVDTRTGEAGKHDGNAGFSAAVAPYLAALGRNDLAQAQVERARSLARQSPLGYYSQVLALFGLGYLDGQYRFDADGTVVPAWKTSCPAPR